MRSFDEVIKFQIIYSRFTCWYKFSFKVVTWTTQSSYITQEAFLSTS